MSSVLKPSHEWSQSRCCFSKMQGEKCKRTRSVPRPRQAHYPRPWWWPRLWDCLRAKARIQLWSGRLGLQKTGTSFYSQMTTGKKINTDGHCFFSSQGSGPGVSAEEKGIRQMPWESSGSAWEPKQNPDWGTQKLKGTLLRENGINCAGAETVCQREPLSAFFFFFFFGHGHVSGNASGWDPRSFYSARYSNDIYLYLNKTKKRIWTFSSYFFY